MASPSKRTVVAKKPAAKKPAAKKPAGGLDVGPSPAFQRVVTALTTHRDVSVRPGWSAGSLVLKTGDKMFALCIHGDLVVKLPKPLVDELVEQGQASRFDPKRNGRVMKEWAVLPLASGSASAWAELAEQARAFVGGARAAQKR